MKKQMLLAELNVRVKGQVREFLEFMLDSDGSNVAAADLSTDKLLEKFINFEEETSFAEFTKEYMSEVLDIYVGQVNGSGFLGNGIF